VAINVHPIELHEPAVASRTAREGVLSLVVVWSKEGQPFKYIGLAGVIGAKEDNGGRPWDDRLNTFEVFDVGRVDYQPDSPLPRPVGRPAFRARVGSMDACYLLTCRD
jgi:hypothetical protein